MHLTPLDTHAGLLIRTWTRYSEPGQHRPHAEQRVYVRNRGHSRTPDPLHHTRTRYPEPGPPHPHVNPLFQAWASSSAREPAIPSLGNPAHMQNSGLTCGTEGLRAEQEAQPYTRPTTSHANPLFRTRAISSARGPAIPSLGNLAHMRNRGFTCGTAVLRAGQGAQPYTRPATSHANPLFRTRAISSARGPAIPSLGNPAHMRNSGLTCGTGGLRAKQQRAVPHGAARLACLRAAHEHCGTARQRRRSAAESPGVMSLARATRSAAGSA